MKIGLFFGSFNPIHTGHMIIANHIVHWSDLEQVWLVVTPLNPFKKSSNLAPDHERLHMVHLAINENYQLRAATSNFDFPNTHTPSIHWRTCVKNIRNMNSPSSWEETIYRVFISGKIMKSFFSIMISWCTNDPIMFRGNSRIIQISKSSKHLLWRSLPVLSVSLSGKKSPFNISFRKKYENI